MLNIIVRVRDEASAQIKSFGDKLKAMEPQFKGMATAGTVAFGALTGAIALSVSEAIESEAAFNRLNQILKTSRGATDAQVDSLVRQAAALEKVGVVSKDNIIVAQSQLATFDLSADAIERLTPAILDYVVAEKGANASTEDLRQLTNGLAQALQGNFASLTRTGFVLDEATKALIENGSETERTAALVKVLNSTYKDFNQSARDTAQGALVVLKNEFNNLRQTIGEAFLPVVLELVKIITPVIERISAWVEKNPELAATIGIIAVAAAGLTAVIGGLGLALLALAGPGGAAFIVIAAITAVGTWLVWLWNNVDVVKENISAALEILKENFKAFAEFVYANTIQPIVDAFQKIIDIIERVKSAAASLAKRTGASIGNAIRNIIPFAEGGVVTKPTIGLVGEAGPEAIVPLNKAAGIGGVTININGGTYLDRNVAEEIGDMIIGNLKATMRI